MDKEKLVKALAEFRKDKERKFDQTVDLIVNLKNFDLRKESFSSVISVPHKIKDVKVAAYKEKKSDVVDTITKLQLEKLTDKKDIKKLIKKYDFFMSAAPIMPKLATVLGRHLGPAGKMPSPQLGIVPPTEDKAAIEAVKEKINKAVKIRTKEPSIKVSVGKISMKDEQILENINAIEKEILNKLPRGKENIRNVLIKLTMSKPVRVEWINKNKNCGKRVIL